MEKTRAPFNRPTSISSAFRLACLEFSYHTRKSLHSFNDILFRGSGVGHTHARRVALCHAEEAAGSHSDDFLVTSIQKYPRVLQTLHLHIDEHAAGGRTPFSKLMALQPPHATPVRCQCAARCMLDAAPYDPPKPDKSAPLSGSSSTAAP
eukprot:scaffold7385_cov533-Prasinococcus_capsulatus_cf.AAC.8